MPRHTGHIWMGVHLCEYFDDPEKNKYEINALMGDEIETFVETKHLS